MQSYLFQHFSAQKAESIWPTEQAFKVASSPLAFTLFSILFEDINSNITYLRHIHLQHLESCPSPDLYYITFLPYTPVYRTACWFRKVPGSFLLPYLWTCCLSPLGMVVACSPLIILRNDIPWPSHNGKEALNTLLLCKAILYFNYFVCIFDRSRVSASKALKM